MTTPYSNLVSRFLDTGDEKERNLGTRRLSVLGMLITFCSLVKSRIINFQVVGAVSNVVKLVTLRENVLNKKTMVEEEVRDNVIIILLCRMVIKRFLPLFVDV